MLLGVCTRVRLVCDRWLQLIKALLNFKKQKASYDVSKEYLFSFIYLCNVISAMNALDVIFH